MGPCQVIVGSAASGTRIDSPGSHPAARSMEFSGIPMPESSLLRGAQKKSLRLLWIAAQHLVRPQDTSRSRSFVRRPRHLSRLGDPARHLSPRLHSSRARPRSKAASLTRTTTRTRTPTTRTTDAVSSAHATPSSSSRAIHSRREPRTPSRSRPTARCIRGRSRSRSRPPRWRLSRRRSFDDQHRPAGFCEAFPKRSGVGRKPRRSGAKEAIIYLRPGAVSGRHAS